MGSVFMPESFSYDRHDGLYRLKCQDAVLNSMDKVAIAFSVLGDGSIIRHHHGEPAKVVEWFLWAKARYEQYGQQDIADELRYVVSDRWDVDELNRIMKDDSYISVFLNRIDVCPESLKQVYGHPRQSGRPSELEISGLPV